MNSNLPEAGKQRSLSVLCRTPRIVHIPGASCAGIVLVLIMRLYCSQSSAQAGQTPEGQQASTVAPLPSRASTMSPKADVILLHGNIYTGALANSQFSSVERQEAVALRGDRILAVGKNPDIEKLK